MRDHAIVSPKFWTGETGRALREAGPDAQRLAFYLITSPNANMIGLYYLPMPTLCHEVGITFEGASKALRRVVELGFCSYDDTHEVVWVHEMARWQIGNAIKPKDNRVKAILKMLETYSKCSLVKGFHEKYGSQFSLPKASPFEGPSEPLRSQEQDQEQEQEQDRDYCSEVASDSEPPEAEPTLLEFPTSGKAKTWGLVQSHIDELSEAFPGVDVLAEARKAALWCQDNPKRRKTPGGMRRFLSTWMERGQNRGQGRSSKFEDIFA